MQRLQFAFILFIGFFLLFMNAPKVLADPAQDFQKGWHEFHDLLKDPEQSRLRSSWISIRNIFMRTYKEDPDGPYAAKSLYYLGRVYNELGKRSGLEADLLQASDYYGRVPSKFGSHSWADDALLRKARLHRDLLDDSAQAYIDYLHIVHTYPHGDMHAKAKKELAELDRINQAMIEETQSENEKQAPSSPDADEINAPPMEETPAVGCISGPPPPRARAAHGDPQFTGIRHWSGPDYTRVVLDLDDSAEYSYQLLNPDPKLNTPNRLFIDLKKVRLSSSVPSELPISGSVVHKVRTARYDRDTTRVVLDIDQLKDAKVFFLQDPYRIVVDVFTPEPVKMAATRGRSGKTQSDGKHGQLQINEASRSMADSLVEQLGLKVQTIMIDPGHGGKDPGACYGKLYEKNINLKFAKILGRQFEQHGFDVLYTRTNDVFLSLEERTALANAKNVDLFLSIHCNAHSSSRVSGLEVYYLNLAKTKDAVRVAARENAVSERKISDLQYILTDLMLNSKIKESQDLAGQVHDNTMKTMRKSYKIKDHGVRQAPFYVLMGAKMPAVLVELGYMTHAKERTLLQSDAYLNKLAQGLVSGVVAYKSGIEQFAALRTP